MSNSDSPTTFWPVIWREAWDAAQPTLSSIRDSLSSSDVPPSRTLRVGQLDSELLDQQLVLLLCEPLQKALGVINTALRTRFDPELNLVVRLILYKFSIWDLGSSYGARLQGLRYSVANGEKGPFASSGLPRRTLLIHGMLTIVLPYCYNRLRAHALSRAWPDAPSHDRRRIAWKTLTRLEATQSFLGLLNFVVFLWNGRHRSVADRLLKMTLVPIQSKVTREVSYEFMNRQMVWHAFTEFLLFLLPFISVRSLRRRFMRIMSRITSTLLLSSDGGSSPLRKRGKYEMLSADQCAVCAENASYTLDLGYSGDTLASLTPLSAAQEEPSQLSSGNEVPTFPIHTPYVTSCGHLYCYYCITERMMRTADEGAETGWECLRCAEHVRSADRWEAELSVDRESGSDGEYEFSSESDTADLSGSVGSYPESMTE